MENQKKTETIYKQRIKTLDVQLNELKIKDRTMGIIKLVLFIIGLLAVFRVFPANPAFSLGVLVFCLTAFTAIAVVHEAIIRKIKYHNALKTINENEIKYLHHEFPGSSANGEEFKNSDHVYTSDLDIFGEKSLFHYVNRAVTAMGRRCLAGWLQLNAGVEETGRRQEAVKELSQKLDLRQTIAAHGMFIDDSAQKLQSLYSLLNEPFIILGKKWLMGFMAVWPVITIGTAVLLIFNVSLAVFFSFVLSQMAVNKIFFKRVSHIYSLTSRGHKILKAYSRIIAEIETGNYSSEKLKQLKGRLGVNEKKASLCIRRFSILLEWFETRHGMLHFFVNNTLLWDLHCIYHIEKWRKQAAAHVPQWFEVIGEFEALSGFAGLYFNNPGWTMPEVHGDRFRMEAANLGHPLIPGKERVCNSIELNREGKINGNLAIVTGPNMAGKSTFLRTVGVNTVLAFAGGPVCAERFIISPFKLFTSMQTSDSLDKHLSLFYAELQRLKMILEGLSRGEPVFFLVDEMLKGTNALDRQKGAIAMLKQLVRSRANGMIATHDLELTKLENPGEWKEPGGDYPRGIHIANYHFDGYIKEDKLLFDYRLKQGICESFNALILMKKMGIQV
jgi:hypothetical protein